MPAHRSASVPPAGTGAGGLSRRRALALAGGTAAVLPLSACGSGAPDTDSAGGKTFRMYWNPGHVYGPYEKVIEEFEKDHGVTVQMQKYQWEDMRTRLLTDFSSGNVPDLVEEPGGWSQEYALSGDALSLQKYVDKDGAEMGYPDDWQQAAVEHNVHKGETYGIQLHQTCSLLMYNKKMFRQAGVEPPKTWEEFVAVCKELTRGDVHGISLNQDQSYGWPWMLQNAVRQYVPKTEKLLVPRDAAIEALQFQADLVHKHKVSPVPTPSSDYSGPQKLLSANRVAMILSGPWDLEPIAKTSPDLELGIAQVPKKVKQSTILAGTSVFIPAKAKQPDLAWDMIKRLTAVDVEIQVTKESGMLMPRKSWAKNPVVQKDPYTKAFAEGLTYAEDAYEGLYLTGHFGEISTDLWQRLYQGVVMEKKPVETAYEEYQAGARRILEG